MDLSNSFVSIIIPTFNRSQLVERAIRSVLNQTYKNFELIIVDDGSTDDTELRLQQFTTNPSIHYYKKENSGVAAARNFGAAKAKGKWMAFLDSDDEWLAHKLQDQINFLQKNSELKIVYGEETWIRNGMRVNQKKHHKKSGGRIFERCLEQCLIAPSSVLLEKNLFDEFKGFDESFVVCEDYDLWIKISSQYEIGFIEHPLIIKYGGHEDQLSTKYFAMDMWRLKSMHNLLISRSLPVNDLSALSALIATMQTKGKILLKGYQKHGNLEDAVKVSQILENLIAN